MAGLLTDWRHGGGGWVGLVMFVGVIGVGDPVLVQAWVDADRLRALQ
jgi:hypothetical protein